MGEQVQATSGGDSSGGVRTGLRSRVSADGSSLKRAGTLALGGALVAVGLRRRSLGGTVLALAGGYLSYRTLSGSLSEAGGVQPVERSITIGESPDELSDLARDPETLERIVGHFADVSRIDEDGYRWSASGPLARELSWETRVAEDEPGERLRWETVDGESGALFDSWSLSFDSAPGERGTEVTLEVRFDPPGGTAGSAAVERLEVVPESLVGTALDRFKSLAETGEVPTTENRPSARGRGDLL